MFASSLVDDIKLYLDSGTCGVFIDFKFQCIV